MVVLHPNHIPRRVVLEHHLPKLLIGCLVCCPLELRTEKTKNPFS